MAARWRKARHLFLCLWGEGKVEDAYAMMAAQSCAKEVTQLQLEWITDRMDSMMDTTGLALLTWLTAHAAHLCSLRLRFERLPTMPSLPHLQHLILEPAKSCSIRPLMHVLPLFTSVQTLCLGNSFSWRGDEKLPDMDLSSLRHLRSVNLTGAVPSALSLPPDAELHVSARWSLCDPVWLSVLPQLRTFRCEWGGNLEELPQLLRVPSGLTLVALSMTDLGSSKHPLRLCHLCADLIIDICCRHAWVDLRGGMWKDLSIFATKSLQLASPLPTLLQCPQFSFCHPCEHERRKMPACVVPPSIWQYWPGGRRTYLMKHVKGQQIYSQVQTCTCRACMRCLVGSGAMPRHGYIEKA